jgi:hydroxymethylbilane synthase
MQIEQIHTLGDRNTTMPLSAIGGDGVFVMEIERALLEGRIDLAVHSLKDLPTAQPTGLCTCIVGGREDARDVLVWSEQYASMREWDFTGSQGGDKRDNQGGGKPRPYPIIDEVPNPNDVQGRGGACPRPGNAYNDARIPVNMRIGTCSLRRTAQLRAWLPDIEILPLRGNVDTRLRKLDAGEYDAIVLAAAGLHRLGARERVAQRMTYLPFDVMLPAPGQGALALEMRDEEPVRELVVPLRDSAIAATTSAERMFMRRLGAGCYLPIAAYGEIEYDKLTLQGLVISLDGKEQVRVRSSIPWTAQTNVEYAEQLGVQLAEQALAQGAAKIIETVNERRVREHASLD